MPPCYLSEEQVSVQTFISHFKYSFQSLRIAPGDLVRVKIVGTRVDAAEIVSFITKTSFLIISFIVCNWYN